MSDTHAHQCHALPKNFLRASLLLLLRERPAHGYDLVERLRPLGFDADDHGRLYRALHRLEHEGLVASRWSPSHAGPSRRVYVLTQAGATTLHDEAVELGEASDILGDFLCRCAEVDTTLAPPASQRSHPAESRAPASPLRR